MAYITFRQFPTNPIIAQARQAFEEGKIPWDAYQAFRSQVHSAKRREIPFLFTIEDWWNWWQVDGRWHHRGMGSNKMVMSRKGDQGPYSLENVDCRTHAENIAEIPSSKRTAALLAGWERTRARGGKAWLSGKRGDRHPKSKAVITPNGRFGSIAVASEAHGITRQAGFYRLKRPEETGWRYETDTEVATDAQPDMLAAD